jgi:serine/threonine protein kinase
MNRPVERVRIGDYRLEAELTASPSARTYRATHQVLPRQAVVKIACEPHDSLGVLREACILAALPHPGIVRVYEVGRLDDHRTWFASEIVEGLTLAGTLELGALDAAVAIGIVRDVAEILAHGHQRGVVHAGLVPDRIVLTARTRGFPLCITDWSAARTHDAQSIHMWEPGPYTAPELARGELDDRADVFALGAIAYRALTGEAPDGAPIAALAPELPRSVTTLVEQMLAYDRWDRPSSAEVRADLAGLADDAPTEMLRIRKPRWTPPLHFAPGEGEELLASTPTLDDLEPPKPE